MESIKSNFLSDVHGRVVSHRAGVMPKISKTTKRRSTMIDVSGKLSSLSRRHSVSTTSSYSSNENSFELESLSLPIDDIQLLFKGQKPPDGYTKMMRIGSNAPMDLNKGFAGKTVEICVRRGFQSPITSIVLIQEGRGEFVPVGYEIVGVSMAGQFMADITCSMGSSGRVFLCVLRGDGSPITNLAFIQVDEIDQLPKGFGLLERSPMGFSVMLNEKNRQNAGFLCVKRSFEWIQPLIDVLGGTTFEADVTVNLFPNVTDILPTASLEVTCSYCEFSPLSALLRACILYDIPCAIMALTHLEKAMASMISDPHTLGIVDVIVKLASDCTEMGIDVMFAPAMTLLVSVIDSSANGLHWVSMHYICQAMVRAHSFFNLLPLQSYFESSKSGHLFKNPACMGHDVQMHHDELLERCSVVGLQDINFLRQCSSRIVERIIGDLPPFEKTDQDVIQLAKQGNRFIAHCSSVDPILSDEIVQRITSRIGYNCSRQVNAMTMLLWVSKAAGMPLTKPLRKGRLFNSEQNAKLTLLELLREFLSCASSNSFFASDISGYLIRFFVFPVVLENAHDQLHCSLNVATELWKHKSFRRHLKAEFHVLIEKVILPILKSKDAQACEKFAMIELTHSWFGTQVFDLVELFLNFESEPLIRGWTSFEHTIDALASMKNNVSGLDDRQWLQDMEDEALRTLVSFLKSITDMSGTQRLVREDGKTGRRSFRGLVVFQDDAPPTESKDVRSRDEYNVARAGVFEIARNKGVKYALRELGKLGEMPEYDAVATANYLHLYHAQLGERNVGQYLGSSGSSDREKEFMDETRLEFTRRLSFEGKSFEQCLRIFLEQGNFFLPGESQQIENLLVAFAQCFVEENACKYGEGIDTDLVMVLAYSTVMLNTDLHNPNVNKKKKMTLEQFLKQVSYIKDGDKISNEFATNLYKSIAHKEIRTASESSSNNADVESEIPASFAAQKDIMEKDHKRNMAEAVRQCKIILAGQRSLLPVYSDKVQRSSIQEMFQVSWIHFYGVVTKILENPKTYSLDSVSLALDILSYSLSICLFLDMESERRAFAGLLAKLNYLYMHENQHRLGVVKGEHLKNKLYESVMSTCCYSENVVYIVAEIHHLTASMKEKIATRQTYEELLAIQKRFDGNIALIEPNREFLREGDLLKKNRNGKFTKYHFFLFTDILIYAGYKSLTNYKLVLHKQLRLHTMQVREVEGSKLSFEIQHPDKSFIVQAKTESERNAWMRDIYSEISSFYRKQMASQSGFHISDPMDVLEALHSASSDEDRTESSITDSSHSDSYDNEACTVADTDSSVENSIFLALDEKDLHKKFVVGLRFAKPILMSNHSQYNATDHQKLMIYGLFKQSTKGDCNLESPPSKSDTVSYSKFKIWEKLQGTETNVAKQKFLSVLNDIAPGWHEKTQAA